MSSNSFIFTTSITSSSGNTAQEINERNTQIQGWYNEEQDFVNMNTPLPIVPSNQRTVKGE